MSKFQDYIPQALPVYRGLPNYPGGASQDTHYQNYQLSQVAGDLTTFKYALPNDGTNYVIPPMLVKRAAGGAAISSFGLYNLDGSAAQIFLTIPTNSAISLDSGPVYEAVLFDGQRVSASGTSAGQQYYFKFSDGTNYWYTEVFEFFTSGTIPASGAHFTLPNKCGDAEWIQLIWSNPDCILSETYPVEATFVLNLQAVVSRPQYKYTTKPEDDGRGGNIDLFKRLDKRWEFFILGPEYLADALVSILMFSELGIVFQYGDTVECTDVEVETEAQPGGLIRTTFRFSTTFLISTGCCG